MKKFTTLPGMPTYDPNNKELFKTVTREINGKKIDVIFRKGNPGISYETVAKLRAEGKPVSDFSICPDLNPDMSFEGDLKAPSVVFVGLVAQLEDEFDKLIGMTEAAAAKTIRGLAELIDNTEE